MPGSNDPNLDAYNSMVMKEIMTPELVERLRKRQDASVAEPRQASAEPPECSHPDCHITLGLTETDLGTLCGLHVGAAVDICRGEQRLMDSEAQVAALRQVLGQCVGALETINRLTSPGSRTLDDFMRDNGFACDIARGALAAAAKLMEAQ